MFAIVCRTTKHSLNTYLSNVKYSTKIANALRTKKSKSQSNDVKYKKISPLTYLLIVTSFTKVQSFLDTKHTRTLGGKGGDGCVSFLSLWCNENAGPDGADGGNGGHVVFQVQIFLIWRLKIILNKYILQASYDVNNFSHVPSIIKAIDGDKGRNKDCHGKNAEHKIVKVPVGTILKNNFGRVVGDMNKDGVMFVAARGGAGGKGNHFFITDSEHAPKVCEYGASGEDISYRIELKSMANVGLVSSCIIYYIFVGLL